MRAHSQTSYSNFNNSNSLKNLLYENKQLSLSQRKKIAFNLALTKHLKIKYDSFSTTTTEPLVKIQTTRVPADIFSRNYGKNKIIKSNLNNKQFRNSKVLFTSFHNSKPKSLHTLSSEHINKKFYDNKTIKNKSKKQKLIK